MSTYYQIVLYAWEFPPNKFFSSSNLKPSAPAISKCVLIRACTGINGVSLAHHISYTSIATFLLKFIFANKHWRETFKEIKEKKKFFDDFLFWGITLINGCALDSCCRSPKPGWVIVLWSWAKQFALTELLSTQGWVVQSWVKIT